MTDAELDALLEKARYATLLKKRITNGKASMRDSGGVRYSSQGFMVANNPVICPMGEGAWAIEIYDDEARKAILEIAKAQIERWEKELAAL